MGGEAGVRAIGVWREERREGMKLTADYVHVLAARGDWPDDERDRARVRLYGEEGKQPVAVVTELPGSWITDQACYFAAEIILLHALSGPFVYVEHMTAERSRTGHSETYDIATFLDHRPERFHRSYGAYWLPHGLEWRPSSRAEIEALIEASLVDEDATWRGRRNF